MCKLKWCVGCWIFIACFVPRSGNAVEAALQDADEGGEERGGISRCYMDRKDAGYSKEHDYVLGMQMQPPVMNKTPQERNNEICSFEISSTVASLV